VIRTASCRRFTSAAPTLEQCVYVVAGAAPPVGVGLYTSALNRFERIVVDGIPISEPAVAMWANRLNPARWRRHFELTTAMAFADFAARGAEIAVVEVGLGGRLDSTNVITPLVSGVTKIARDHMKYLGDSLEEIAREKAGIAKPGIPFVIGERNPGLVEVMRAEARRTAAEAGRRSDIRVLPPEYQWVGRLGLAGPHQRRNAGVAHGLLMALPAPYRLPGGDRGGFCNQVPGRLDRRGKALSMSRIILTGWMPWSPHCGRTSPAGARSGFDPG
jgi:dihydrofolate synthase/folylpolyglutamate synthase